ncbi:protein-serine/threonine phosphatase [Clostridia bacterium]|nr:protein-serine/threonine phosphatase [Clostridia bacterium]
MTNSNISFTGNTDQGKQRTNNEDAYIAQYVWDEKHLLVVAIDGVGGYEGGEVAAGIAQKTMVEYLEKYPNGERLDLLKQAVVFANNSIFKERQKLEKYAQMSCVLTAVVVEVEKKQINMVHVGDTRLYQYHKDELQKLSHDHSLVGYREEIGDLTEEEAMHHPQRNVISRDVGSEHHEIGDRDFLEAAVFPLLPDTTLLLCSDGLCDMITSAQITEVLQQKNSLEDKAEKLIEKANEAGGKDNITVVLVRMSAITTVVPKLTKMIVFS